MKKDIGYLLLDVNQASVVNGGSRAYTPYSPQVRKLKEGFFFAALTPTLRHLGKLEAELKGKYDMLICCLDAFVETFLK